MYERAINEALTNRFVVILCSDSKHVSLHTDAFRRFVVETYSKFIRNVDFDYVDSRVLFTTPEVWATRSRRLGDVERVVFHNHSYFEFDPVASSVIKEWTRFDLPHARLPHKFLDKLCADVMSWAEEAETATSFTPLEKRLMATSKELESLLKDILDLEESEVNSETKGAFGGLCNRQACLSPGATWFNRSTQRYYCAKCGYQLNCANPDAQELYNGPLCVKSENGND